MTKIYDQYQAAFANVSAYVVVKDGERVATIAFKFPRDGAGRLYAYVHWIGTEMVRGFVGGYGYDKRSAAVSSAIAAIKIPVDWSNYVANNYRNSYLAEFIDAMRGDSGKYWDDRLRDAGFTVLQAV